MIHQLTSLPKVIDPRKLERQLAANDRIRVEGTRNLVRAAVRSGAARILAQSVSFAYAPVGGPIKGEDAPLWLDAPRPWRRSVEALAALERQVVSAERVDGFVLRYGNLYGPGTAYATDGAIADLVRRRRFPIVGKGLGVYSFVHVDDAASATVAAVGSGRPGVFNVVDDDPAPVRDWLPVYAECLHAPRPMRVPTIIARPLAGSFGVHLMTKQRGATNAKAKAQLGWSPRLATWRTGFRETLEATGAD